MLSYKVTANNVILPVERRTRVTDICVGCADNSGIWSASTLG